MFKFWASICNLLGCSSILSSNILIDLKTKNLLIVTTWNLALQLSDISTREWMNNNNNNNPLQILILEFASSYKRCIKYKMLIIVGFECPSNNARSTCWHAHLDWVKVQQLKMSPKWPPTCEHAATSDEGHVYTIDRWPWPTLSKITHCWEISGGPAMFYTRSP